MRAEIIAAGLLTYFGGRSVYNGAKAYRVQSLFSSNTRVSGKPRGSFAVDILIILGLIFLNGVFAMSELAVVSSKRIWLEKLSENGSRGARAALHLENAVPAHIELMVQFSLQRF